MKAPTEKQRQWLWFVLLWCGGYTGYCYYVFRGKASHEGAY